MEDAVTSFAISSSSTRIPKRVSLLEQQVNYSFFRHPAELPAFLDSIHYAKGTSS